MQPPSHHTADINGAQPVLPGLPTQEQPGARIGGLLNQLRTGELSGSVDTFCEACRVHRQHA